MNKIPEDSPSPPKSPRKNLKESVFSDDDDFRTPLVFKYRSPVVKKKVPSKKKKEKAVTVPAQDAIKAKPKRRVTKIQMQDVEISDSAKKADLEQRLGRALDDQGDFSKDNEYFVREPIPLASLKLPERLQPYVKERSNMCEYSDSNSAPSISQEVPRRNEEDILSISPSSPAASKTNCGVTFSTFETLEIVETLELKVPSPVKAVAPPSKEDYSNDLSLNCASVETPILKVGPTARKRSEQKKLPKPKPKITLPRKLKAAKEKSKICELPIPSRASSSNENESPTKSEASPLKETDPNGLNYSTVETPVLKKELKRFGLKPLPRSKAKLILRHINRETKQK